jgi:hypothetical protein
MLGKRMIEAGRSAKGPLLAAALLASLPLLEACSSLGLGSPPPAAPETTSTVATAAPPPSPGLTERLSGFFGGAPTKTATEGVGGPSTDVDCPLIEVRKGASTLSINANERDPAATALRYQLTIGRTARQCAVVGTEMRIKVGVQGRVILGPAGGPGNVEVPLRYAVVADGPQPRTIVTKFFRIPVAVAADQTNVPFTHVDEALTFPMPAATDDLVSYVIYVGFDPDSAKPPERKPERKPAKAAKQRPPS